MAALAALVLVVVAQAQDLAPAGARAQGGAPGDITSAPAGPAPRLRWEEQALPLDRGVVEARLGLGVGFTRLWGTEAVPGRGDVRFDNRSTEVWPDLDLRVGVTRWLELDLPVVARVTVRLDEAGAHGLVFSGGLHGFMVSNIGRNALYWLAGAQAFVRRPRFIAFLEAQVLAGQPVPPVVPWGWSLTGELGLLYRVTEGLSLGATLGAVAWPRAQAWGPGGRGTARLRWHLTSRWALDVWARADAAPPQAVSVETSGVGLSVVWAPRAFDPDGPRE